MENKIINKELLKTVADEFTAIVYKHKLSLEDIIYVLDKMSKEMKALENNLMDNDMKKLELENLLEKIKTKAMSKDL